MQKRRKTLFMAGLFIFLTVTAVVHGEEDIQVSCYRGDLTNNIYIDNIDVFKPELAAGNCNMLYNDCHGNCFGCYEDDDSREVCIDKWGGRFYR